MARDEGLGAARCAFVLVVGWRCAPTAQRGPELGSSPEPRRLVDAGWDRPGRRAVAGGGNRVSTTTGDLGPRGRGRGDGRRSASRAGRTGGCQSGGELAPRRNTASGRRQLRHTRVRARRLRQRSALTPSSRRPAEDLHGRLRQARTAAGACQLDHADLSPPLRAGNDARARRTQTPHDGHRCGLSVLGVVIHGRAAQLGGGNASRRRRALPRRPGAWVRPADPVATRTQSRWSQGLCAAYVRPMCGRSVVNARDRSGGRVWVARRKQP